MKYRFFSLICIVFFFTNQMAAEDGSLFVVKTESRGKCLRRGIGPMHIRNLESGRRRVAAVLERKSGHSADRERQATCPGRFPHTMHGEEARLELPLCNRPAIWSLSPAPPARKRTAIRPSTENPAYSLRILNHWDNMDRTVERGYAGQSLWDWEKLPDTSSGRYEAYARANASIGINGTVLNNVKCFSPNSSTAISGKGKDVGRHLPPYGIRVYLSVNFASPIILGKLHTADPLDKQVIRWWKDKTREIYRLIPDFGGFLVKANSEGQPGPCDFGRTHAEGANMLADALKPYKGIVMWRAFVYNPSDTDRAKQAYTEFKPLDGKFRSNVILQVKNGPIDFQHVSLTTHSSEPCTRLHSWQNFKLPKNT